LQKQNNKITLYVCCQRPRKPDAQKLRNHLKNYDSPPTIIQGLRLYRTYAY